MKYKCLLIDHDDTTVNSSPSIHYRAHLEQMRRMGRSAESLTLEDWFRINYNPGFAAYMDTVLQLSDTEKELCYRIWRQYTTQMMPPFFEGILSLLKQLKDNGGKFIVVSHSESDIIRNHYERQNEVPGLMPDRIIGWTGDTEKNKPSPYPVYNAMEEYDLAKEEILVIDDLKPGIAMAENAGVDSAGAGWSHRVPELQQDITESATFYFESVEQLSSLVLGSPVQKV